ncbi:MAG: EamA family transporter [Chitinophagales bacterium]
MIYLILSIISSSSLLVFFKLFEKYKVNAAQAIAVNYFVAAVVGYVMMEDRLQIASGNQNLILLSGFLGILFSLIFNLSRYTTQKVGLAITSVAMKLGVVFPVIFGVLLYNETFQKANYFGAFLGLVAIILLNYKPNASVRYAVSGKYLFIFPLLVWFGSGICDSSVQFAEISFPKETQAGSFAFMTFLSAGVSTFGLNLIKRSTWTIRSFVGGFCLGIPNYFSIYFLVKCLHDLSFNYNVASSTVFMINNLSVVIFSIFIGLFFFKENFTTLNFIGVVLAIMSIYCISL